MKFHQNIIELTKQNTNFRTVVATGEHSQIVLMSIPPKGEIGLEKHTVDQILIFVEGDGESILNNERSPVKQNHLVFVPAGTMHNFVNTGTRDLKLFTIYAPPEHKSGIVRTTKAEADSIPE
jgi:mannose-6-phosphate isomerase-like protein (cupin superfamily)